MEELKELLEKILNEDLLSIVMSGQKRKEAPIKIRIRPVEQKGRLLFQAAAWDGKKEFHKNYEKEALILEIPVWMSRDYRQLQAETVEGSAAVLVSKKGKVTIKTKKHPEPKQRAELGHDRKKQYLLPEGTPVPFLVKLGVMTAEGRIVRAKYDKFRQINRFLEFIEDITPALAKDRELSVIDFGCGKSYLTFAMYYYLHEIRGFDIRVTGLDLKEDVIRMCNRLAEEFGYEKLRFLVGDIARYEGTSQVDLVVTLHACDTATDFALAKAVGWKAKAILSVPCCQHELNGQIHSEVLEPVLKYGLLQERIAALVTDGLRASMLEEAGYQVQVLEFIDMEHTPKNILIRAIREEFRKAASRRSDESRQNTEAESKACESQQSAKSEGKTGAAQLRECMDFLHVSPTLATLLKADEETVKQTSCSLGTSSVCFTEKLQTAEGTEDSQ